MVSEEKDEDFVTEFSETLLSERMWPPALVIDDIKHLQKHKNLQFLIRNRTSHHD